MATTKAVLERSEIFKGLTGEELDKIAALSRDETYAAGLSIIAEGATASDLYIVVEGDVRVEMSLSVYPGLIQDAVMEAIPPGEPFGWSAVIGSRVYTMTARCVEQSRVVAVDGEGLIELFNKEPEIGFKVMEGLVAVVSSRVKSVKRTLLS